MKKHSRNLILSAGILFRPAGGSKAKGIQQLIDKLGILLEDIYAFGDGLNDVEMLKTVINSVAMGDRHEDARNAAN